MAKRTFLQLCQTYNPKSCYINGWMVSEKLDGMRAFWDGGLTRGLLASDVPWANTIKDGRYIDSPVATGLWSRMGKAIAAPDSFLDQLPNLPLDGELWLGYRRFQETVSITKSLKADWTGIKFKVFDSPSLESIFKDGEYEVRYGNQKYVVRFNGVMDWIKRHKQANVKYLNPNASFESVYNYLLENIDENDIFDFVGQERIGGSSELNDRLERVLDRGGEGLILRYPKSSWTPARVHTCLKFKPFDTDEGTVIGYTWGREGKLLGKMGALIVNFKGQRLYVSGFTDEEREMKLNCQKIIPGGSIVGSEATNPRFPRGSTIKFIYRELTDGGLPKEARYLRSDLA